MKSDRESRTAPEMAIQHLTALQCYVKLLLNDMNEKRNQNHSEIVEEMAGFFEQLGASANLGRMFGLLLTSPEPLSLETIAERMQVSKPAVSVQIRQLEQLRYCSRLPKGSDRKQYFELNPDYLVDNLSLRMEAQDRWIRRLEQKLQERREGADDSATVGKRLEELVQFQRMMQDRYKDLINNFGTTSHGKETEV